MKRQIEIEKCISLVHFAGNGIRASACATATLTPHKKLCNASAFLEKTEARTISSFSEPELLRGPFLSPSDTMLYRSIAVVLASLNVASGLMVTPAAMHHTVVTSPRAPASVMVCATTALFSPAACTSV